MGALVVDSSVVIKWYMSEPGSAQARELLTMPHELHAPELLLLECDAVFCSRVRRGQLQAASMQEIRAGVRQSGVRMHPLVSLLDAGVLTSLTTGKALYDCVYLALAEALDATLVTADLRFAVGLESTALAGRVRVLDTL